MADGGRREGEVPAEPETGRIRRQCSPVRRLGEWGWKAHGIVTARLVIAIAQIPASDRSSGRLDQSADCHAYAD